MKNSIQNKYKYNKFDFKKNKKLINNNYNKKDISKNINDSKRTIFIYNYLYKNKLNRKNYKKLNFSSSYSILNQTLNKTKGKNHSTKNIFKNIFTKKIESNNKILKLSDNKEQKK